MQFEGDMIYDVIVIGGGVIGTATLDRLARYKLKAALLEKDDDVASFSTRANSGIVHAGYDCQPGTLKAYYNVKGNPMVYEDAEALDVSYEKCGSVVVAGEGQLEDLKALKERGLENGVETKILDRQQTLLIEPNVADSVAYSLYAKSAGIVSPYQLAIGYADRAILNGAEIFLEREVKNIAKLDTGYQIETSDGVFLARCVVNCAGPNGAAINDMLGLEKFETQYRRGDYFVLDSSERKNVSTVIFQLPSALGKGVLVSPTADGNVIYGPTAVDTVNGDTASTLDSMEKLKAAVPLSYARPAFNKCIRVYSGLRTIIGHDFVIGQSSMDEDFFMAIGICSPGLTSAPAIAEDLAEAVAKRLHADKKAKEDIVFKLKKKTRLKEIDKNTLAALVKEDPRWGRVICRCEKVTEAEIVEAIHSPLPAKTVDAVKRRTRAGMGRCQGGFCCPRVMEIISRELSIPLSEVKKGLGAAIATYRIKEVDDEKI